MDTISIPSWLTISRPVSNEPFSIKFLPDKEKFPETHLLILVVYQGLNGTDDTFQHKAGAQKPAKIRCAMIMQINHDGKEELWFRKGRFLS